MVQHEATRTLVKSQPEVWAQCSDAESLERHLSGSFGEIRITRLEPEHSVAWEGEQVSGTVRIEPSAWGTRVTMAVQVQGEATMPPAHQDSVVPALTAAGGGDAPQAPHSAQEPPEAQPASQAEPPQTPLSAPHPERRPGLLARVRAQFRRAADPPVQEEDAAPEDAEPEPLVEAEINEQAPIEISAQAAPEPEPTPAQGGAEAALQAALESLGQAHHRPYSRA